MSCANAIETQADLEGRIRRGTVLLMARWRSRRTSRCPRDPPYFDEQIAAAGPARDRKPANVARDSTVRPRGVGAHRSASGRGVFSRWFSTRCWFVVPGASTTANAGPAWALPNSTRSCTGRGVGPPDGCRGCSRGGVGGEGQRSPAFAAGRPGFDPAARWRAQRVPGDLLGTPLQLQLALHPIAKPGVAEQAAIPRPTGARTRPGMRQVSAMGYRSCGRRLRRARLGPAPTRPPRQVRPAAEQDR
jgi:hypothetical protein